MLIYKILRPVEWAAMQAAEQTTGSPVDLADGYIHFSTAAQTPGTLAKHFADEDGLTLLACDTDGMGADLKWEPARDGDKFPHLYRPLLMADIRWTRLIPITPTGHETGILE